MIMVAQRGNKGKTTQQLKKEEDELEKGGGGGGGVGGGGVGGGGVEGVISHVKVYSVLCMSKFRS